MDKGYKFGKSECSVCGKNVADNWYIRHLKKEHPISNDASTPKVCISCDREPPMDRPGAKICSVCFIKRIAELLDDGGVEGKLVRAWLLRPVNEYEELIRRIR